MTKVQAQGKPLLSVVVPVYYEEEVIGEFYARTHAALAVLEDQCEHELIFVNDGSHDRTLEILQGLAATDPRVYVLDLSRNFGHQFAITAGIDFAHGDAVVVIDSDLQDPPEVIAEMVRKWQEGYQVVYGVRTRRAGESRFKLWTASLFYRMLQRLSDVPLPVDAGDFRLMGRPVVDVFNRMRERHRYVRGMVSWIGFKQCGVPYARDKRYAGTTKYTLRKMIRLAMDGVTNFSEKPLYAAGYLGFVVTMLSFLMIVYVVIGRLVNPESVTSGWTSLLLAVLFMGGLQLLSIGLLGQYVGRIFAETKGRPLYIVARTIGDNQAAAKPPAAGRGSQSDGEAVEP